jgi:hypothetical protein
MSKGNGEPSKLSIMTTWAVLVITVVLIVWGFIRYGISLQTHERFWADIADRLHGPMTFRFYLQPTMALIAALHDGVRDARLGHKAFFWTALWDKTQERGRLREGLIATSRIALLGLGMDTLYQIKVFDTFHPIEAVAMALLLAVIPYFIFRWIIEHVARWWFAHHPSPHTSGR